MCVSVRPWVFLGVNCRVDQSSFNNVGKRRSVVAHRERFYGFTPFIFPSVLLKVNPTNAYTQGISGDNWEHVLDGQKKKKGVKLDNELDTEDYA